MKVVIVSGPTATGKTDTAINLAREFGGEIVNFDSLLLYQEITIGTAKPTLEERKEIPHHLIDVTSIASPLNASDYMRMALPVIERLLSERKTVYLVGGSGFYLQAVLKGMYDSPATPPEILERSEKLYAEEGIAPFLEILRVHDPGSFSRYHENDHYRIRRAVEHWWANGTAFFEERQKKNSSNEVLSETNVHGWDVFHAYLDLPKDEHLRIIEKRTRKMLETGLIEEVEGLLAGGFTGEEKPLQSIGYKEALDFIRGNLKSREECEERIIISTRQLAKSQRTWFNRDKSKRSYLSSDTQTLKQDVREFLKIPMR